MNIFSKNITLFDYVDTLSLIIKREDIIKMVDDVAALFESKLDHARDFEKTKGINDYLNDDFVKKFHQAMFKAGIKSTGEIYTDLRIILESVVANISKIYSTIKQEFPKKLAKGEMDGFQLQLLRYVDGLEFFLTFTANAENYALDGKKISIEENKSYDTYLKDYFSKDPYIYKRAMDLWKLYAQPLDKYLKSIERFKKIGVSSHDIKTLQHNITGKDLVSGFIPVALNPFWYIGSWWTEFVEMRYRKMKLERNRYQLIIETIKEKTRSTPDQTLLAKYYKQIEYYTEKLNNINAKIEDYEEV